MAASSLWIPEGASRMSPRKDYFGDEVKEDVPKANRTKCKIISNDEILDCYLTAQINQIQGVCFLKLCDAPGDVLYKTIPLGGTGNLKATVRDTNLCLNFNDDHLWLLMSSKAEAVKWANFLCSSVFSNEPIIRKSMDENRRLPAPPPGIISSRLKTHGSGFRKFASHGGEQGGHQGLSTEELFAPDLEDNAGGEHNYSSDENSNNINNNNSLGLLKSNINNVSGVVGGGAGMVYSSITDNDMAPSVFISQKTRCRFVDVDIKKFDGKKMKLDTIKDCVLNAQINKIQGVCNLSLIDSPHDEPPYKVFLLGSSGNLIVTVKESNICLNYDGVYTWLLMSTRAEAVNWANFLCSSVFSNEPIIRKSAISNPKADNNEINSMISMSSPRTNSLYGGVGGVGGGSKDESGLPRIYDDFIIDSSNLDDNEDYSLLFGNASHLERSSYNSENTDGNSIKKQLNRDLLEKQKQHIEETKKKVADNLKRLKDREAEAARKSEERAKMNAKFVEEKKNRFNPLKEYENQVMKQKKQVSEEIARNIRQAALEKKKEKKELKELELKRVLNENILLKLYNHAEIAKTNYDVQFSKVKRLENKLKVHVAEQERRFEDAAAVRLKLIETKQKEAEIELSINTCIAKEADTVAKSILTSLKTDSTGTLKPMIATITNNNNNNNNNNTATATSTTTSGLQLCSLCPIDSSSTSNNSAILTCTQCKIDICQRCCDNHKNSRLGKDHTYTPLSNNSKSSSKSSSKNNNNNNNNNNSNNSNNNSSSSNNNNNSEINNKEEEDYYDDDE